MKRAVIAFLGLLCINASALAHESATCPSEIKRPAKCFTGTQASGAVYWIALPDSWNNVLVVHAHGGPRIRGPNIKADRDDLERFAMMVDAGYAWIHSSYRRGGFGVRMAIEDTQDARRIFFERIGKPRLTILHGQSWGGQIAAKAMELQAETKSKLWDGALLTAGMLAGGTRGYDFRIDLRAVYQYYCRNHPRANEAQYPLNQGLASGAKMTFSDIRERVEECLALGKKPDERTPEQRRKLENILKAVRIEERALINHMSWATIMFSDIVHQRLGGRSPFGNMNVRYSGTDNDEALNSGVARFAPDPQAVKSLAHDSDLYGVIDAPVMSMHAIGDAIAFVEAQAAYFHTVQKAAKGELLMQAYIDERTHSGAPPPVYAALLDQLVNWIGTGKKPPVSALISSCQSHQRLMGGRCAFLPDFIPPSFDSRVRAR